MIQGFITLLVIIFVLTGAYFVNHFDVNKNITNKDKKTVAKNNYIKLMSSNNDYWYVFGSNIQEESNEIIVENLKAINKDYTIESGFGKIDEKNNVAFLDKNVSVKSNDLNIFTPRATFYINQNFIKGDSSIVVKTDSYEAKGKSFTIYLRPFHLVINDVNSNMYGNFNF